MPEITTSIQLVRRYGLNGGMESYVYHLVQALAQQGQRVIVLCECNEMAGEQHDGIDVIELGNRFRKPRWLAQWGFSQRVEQALVDMDIEDAVIHSHERSSVHQVTTFHGPPFLLRKKKWLDVISPRIHMWTYLEKQELLSPQVKAILPNSDLINEQLKTLYPGAAHKLVSPAYPGVSEHFVNLEKNTDGLTIGFLGREWKRKGLDIACRIVESLRQHNPAIRFVVGGCETAEIAHLFKDWPQGSYQLLGWLKPETLLSQVDLLLHPARAEPFGMVIAEANAVGIPVVISEQCGIANLLSSTQGRVCGLKGDNWDLAEWQQACETLLNTEHAVEPLGLSWSALAEQHIALYQSL